MLCDNIPTIQHVHYKLFKLLQLSTKNLITKCNHPLHPERCLNCASMSEGASLSSNDRRIKIMNKLITDASNDNKDVNDYFVEIFL